MGRGFIEQTKRIHLMQGTAEGTQAAHRACCKQKEHSQHYFAEHRNTWRTISPALPFVATGCQPVSPETSA
jgi:hypothetical protein